MTPPLSMLSPAPGAVAGEHAMPRASDAPVQVLLAEDSSLNRQTPLLGRVAGSSP